MSGYDITIRMMKYNENLDSDLQAGIQWDILGIYLSIYPLANVYITMENHHF